MRRSGTGASRAPRTAVLTALVVTVALALSACDAGGSGGGTGTGGAAGADGVAVVPAGERVLPRALAGRTLEGRPLDIADRKGQVVVINVWGSWCPPCIAEAPHFVEVAKETEGKGVAFVGIDTRDPDRIPALAFQKDLGLPYPSLYDPTGKLILDGFPKGTLNPQTLPSTIFLDREGRIAARALRAIGADGLREVITPLLAEK
ncbi:TlpA family protein disulfide reductase [Streptomyces liangshanensis]|uniref:TlpA family protein disulfide reductase n=1 Tax=Streptomyces liangshanensis TaxID=2717324 RepID=UPI001FB8E0F5|nr:TlpA disulfide reductase family protein [Streptomyces liangshanensis]